MLISEHLVALSEAHRDESADQRRRARFSRLAQRRNEGINQGRLCWQHASQTLHEVMTETLITRS